MTKITIITATYNAAATLRQTIEGVLSQDYPAVEYIIVDGGSTDGTVDIIKSYAEGIAKWISEPDRGIYDAFNKGARLATGDYVLYLGADDIFVDSNVLSRIMAAMNPDTDILSAGIMWIDDFSKLQKYGGNEHAADRENNILEKKAITMIPHPGMLTRRKLLLEQPFDISYRIAADYLFFLKCYYNKSIIFQFLPHTPVVYFSQGGVSGTQSDKLQAECVRIVESLGLKLDTVSRKNFIKQKIVNIKALRPLLGLVRRYFLGWTRHSCNNPYCRWCGRA